MDGYTAEEDDEISFSKGLVVDVLQKSLDGWWLVRCEGKTGLAPATFLKKATEQSENGHVSAPVILWAFLYSCNVIPPTRARAWCLSHGMTGY